MTLGQHPHKLPTEWLIPPETFDSEYDIMRFHQVAPGLGWTGLATWVAVLWKTSRVTASSLGHE